MSEDKNHNYHQVEAFEARAFEVFREKIRPDIKHWKRFSDGCLWQVWSHFMAADMVWRCAKNSSYKTFPTIDLKQMKGKVSIILLVPLLSVPSIEQ